MKCKACKYYDSIGDNAGVCRRFPPQQDSDRPDAPDSQPVTNKDAWCGEYKAK